MIKSSRILLAAAAAAFLTTASYAAAPNADQVSVPAQAESRHQQKMQALFNTPDEFLVFRMQMHQATHGMDHAQKHAYRKAQFQKLKAMTTAQRDAYLKDLDAQWNALPPEKKAHLERRMQSAEAKHQYRHSGRNWQNGDQTPPPPQQ